MLELTLIGVALALAAGAAVKVVTDRSDLTTGQITRSEFVLGSLIVVAVLAGVTATGLTIAKNNALTFNEYWSGFEVSADVQTVPCSKDGPCSHEYNCDSWTTTSTSTDSKGNVTTTTTTHWHDCPYVTEEYVYTVTDSMGEIHVLGDHWWPVNPDAHRWTGSGYDDAEWSWGAPDTPRDVPTGEPALWRAAKNRIGAGNPGGVTSVHTYDNYIMASQDEVLKQYSGSIDRYQKAGLMPTPARGVHDHYLADKVYFVGRAPADAATWQESVTRFNGALGYPRQGDLHVIVVSDRKVTDPDDYTAAVQAYWQSPDLGDDALSKNGLVVVLGSADGGRTVDWARAFTGMPKGNERLLLDISEDLPGEDLTPSAILGAPRAVIRGGEVATVEHGDGALESLVFAEDAGFVRVHMKDFDYLESQIEPGTGAKVLVAAIGFLLSLVIWGVFLAVGEVKDWRPAARHNSRKDYDEYDRRIPRPRAPGSWESQDSWGPQDTNVPGPFSVARDAFGRVLDRFIR